ncbi:hypothetical protein J6590_003301 [Homalodisca vitripennis]|nr:hypothetical protein J6590_003301 [Homalodisca vitripennis]
MARASGFIKKKKDIFYDTLTKIVDVNKLQAVDIFNVDETALSTVQRPHISRKHVVEHMLTQPDGTNHNSTPLQTTGNLLN